MNCFATVISQFVFVQTTALNSQLMVFDWLGRLSVKLLFIEPGSSWENGYIESFNGKMRDEFLISAVF